MSTESRTPNFCSQCGSALPAAARFCPQCGVATSGAAAAPQSPPIVAPLSRMGGRGLTIVLIAAAAVWVVAWNTTNSLAGVKPTRSYEEMVAKNEGNHTTARESAAPENDAELEQLRSAVSTSPKDAAVLRSFAEALLVRLEQSESPPPALALEAIDTMRALLELDPKDRFALRGMADVSLNQQVFPKAIEYYQRYLELQADDAVARSRYASALAFSGRERDAVVELDTVLKADPNNFHARAYLSITYAKMGEREKAMSAGDAALKVAPNEEARARFSEFLTSLKSGAAQGPVVQNPRGNSAPETEAAPGTAPAGVSGLEQMIRENKVAGPKFVAMQTEGDTVRLIFDNFPMDKMPPFVREKFVNGIQAKALEVLPSTVKRVVFLDKADGRELQTLELKR